MVNFYNSVLVLDESKKKKKKKKFAALGFDPRTCGLWAHHSSSELSRNVVLWNNYLIWPQVVYK